MRDSGIECKGVTARDPRESTVELGHVNRDVGRGNSQQPQTQGTL